MGVNSENTKIGTDFLLNITGAFEHRCASYKLVRRATETVLPPRAVALVQVTDVSILFLTGT